MPALTLGAAVTFRAEKKSIRLDRLFGMPCEDNATPVRARGPALIATSLGRHEAGGLKLLEHRIAQDNARLIWQTDQGALRLESNWQFSAATGVLSRKDRLTNTGKLPVTIYRCLPRFTLAPGHYEVYAQQSRWSNESQGAWIPLHTGSLTLSCEWGRNTQNGTPYACLREVGVNRGVAFHVIPHGNWVIRFSTRMPSNPWPFVAVELGLADEDLHLILAPGESLDLPEILIQDLPDGEPRSAATALHRYINARLPAPTLPEIPIIYNTWFDHMSALDVPRLREQLKAARAIGCEAFVVDAGWFGPGDAGWDLVGDWREKTDCAFHGRMKNFADEVRAAGLGFGLWMEPERVVAKAPIRLQHPEWFFPGEPRFNLDIPAARDYLHKEIARLIETYDLAWIKLDYNVSLGYDGSGAELSRYYDVWHRMLDDLRRAYPRTVFENCSSGAMRLDLSSLFHYDCHFLSDSVNPLDVIRIGEGSLLRLPPGRILRWAVLRGIGQTVPDLMQRMEESAERLVVPGGATWQIVESADVDYILGAALPGILGFSGDLLTVPAAARERIRWYVQFAKQWRGFMLTAVVHLLTPPRLMTDRAGWTALQLQSPETTTSLVFTYHLPNDGSARRCFRLHGLHPDQRYTVRKVSPDGTVEALASGEELMHNGMEVVDPCQQHARWQAHITIIEPLSSHHG
ncbi:MAG: alpha-galactosidase [Kiritimatiellaeota bacterium]|nr:alpha-galactosidase [Kiritimatiellota bacterium]